MATNKEIFDESILYPSTKKQTKKKKRVFKAIFENPDGIVVLDGKYHGTKPKQAASKAYTKIQKIFECAGKPLTSMIYFGLKECTRKKEIKKCFWYTGIKKKLPKPAQSRQKKDLTTGKPYINPDTGKPIVDPATGKEVIDLKTCKPLLDSSGNPVVIFHNFTNDIKKSKIVFCKHLLGYTQIKDDTSDTNSFSSEETVESVEKKPKKKIIKNKTNNINNIQNNDIEKKPKKKQKKNKIVK